MCLVYRELDESNNKFNNMDEKDIRERKDGIETKFVSVHTFVLSDVAFFFRSNSFDPE